MKIPPHFGDPQVTPNFHPPAAGTAWAQQAASARGPRVLFLSLQTFWTLLVGAGSIVYTVGHIAFAHHCEPSAAISALASSPASPWHSPWLSYIKWAKIFQAKQNRANLGSPSFNIHIQCAGSWEELFMGLACFCWFRSGEGGGEGGQFSTHTAFSTDFNKCFKPQRSLSSLLPPLPLSV